jgi:hypothetical protein
LILPFNGQAVGAELVLLVREFMARQIGAFGEQIASFGKRLEEVEKRVPIPGPPGPAGKDGESIQGKDGLNGRDGLNAFEIARERGFKGSEADWLVTLKGEPGTPGESVVGPPGQDGKSVSVEELQVPIREAVSDIVTRVEADLITRTDAYLAALPKPQDGRDGVDGADGKSITLEDVTPFIHDEIRKSVAELPPPEKGDKGDSGETGPAGKDGESVDPEVVQRMVDDAVAAAVASIPRPKDGEKGDRGSDGLDGKDAEPVSLEEVRSMLSELVQKAIAEIPVPQNGLNGKDGRDALQLEILPAVDHSKSYPRNTYAKHAGGLIRAFRDTEPIDTHEIEKSGWEVVQNGIAHEIEETSDDGRSIKRTTIYTSGKRYERDHKIAVLVYHGIYKSDREYFRGDVVTWGGEAWHCNADNVKEEPRYQHGGTSSWSMMVKRGRDGKDAKK